MEHARAIPPFSHAVRIIEYEWMDYAYITLPFWHVVIMNKNDWDADAPSFLTLSMCSLSCCGIHTFYEMWKYVPDDWDKRGFYGALEQQQSMTKVQMKEWMLWTNIIIRYNISRNLIFYCNLLTYDILLQFKKCFSQKQFGRICPARDFALVAASENHSLKPPVPFQSKCRVVQRAKKSTRLKEAYGRTAYRVASTADG